MTTLIIPIIESNLELIAVLNDDVKPKIQKRPTYFLIETGRREIITLSELADLDVRTREVTIYYA